MRDFLLFIKYPYTAGIIAIIWLGSACFLALSDNIDLIQVVIVDLLTTVIIAIFGFKDKKEI
ncbi:MAG: hypothetical protein OXF30_00140 [Candidatus Saccharibacteria bacterium]|nr:hypothetical protein [Candidatus Saccharibacteria bacterium]